CTTEQPHLERFDYW
nr:immunoglobulin heavy chain junction region [Macaca mulatta]